MNRFKYRWILYFISAVIFTTLCIQGYWNYKNYQLGKQQLINDVQTSIDNAVDQYFTQLATGESFKFIKDSVEINLSHTNITNANRDSIQIIINDSNRDFKTHSVVRDKFSTELKMIKSHGKDTVNSVIIIQDSLGANVRTDSINTYFEKLSEPIEWLSSKIILSLSENELSLSKIDSIFKIELKRKNIAIDYGLRYTNPFYESQELRADLIENAKLKTASKSPFFVDHSKLTVHFDNVTLAVLKKNSFGMLLSFLLVTSVIVCLLYLLSIIKHQKQLAEVKNDLISNITHEFKTPIATIGAAMEAIQTFNSENDAEKNIRYSKISSEQVEKLNGMVEKLLETATLDSEKLTLNFEEVNLVELLRKTTHKEAFTIENKTITFEASEETLIYSVDIFHFENALNNIIDNAVKYGGNEISAEIKKVNGQIEISISDTGTSLSEANKKQIFEKFYRVPKGNTHDVKGFGIGLYYSKKIIEKHQGTISLNLTPQTSFKITLPYGS